MLAKGGPAFQDKTLSKAEEGCWSDKAPVAALTSPGVVSNPDVGKGGQLLQGVPVWSQEVIVRRCHPGLDQAVFLGQPGGKGGGGASSSPIKQPRKGRKFVRPSDSGIGVQCRITLDPVSGAGTSVVLFGMIGTSSTQGSRRGASGGAGPRQKRTMPSTIQPTIGTQVDHQSPIDGRTLCQWYAPG